MTKTRKALINSIISLMLCFSMLLGTTWAWFTDSVTSANNIIQSGRLKAQMEYADDLTGDSWQDASTGSIFDYQHWEPGFTQIKYIKVKNTGNLAFKYLLNIAPNGAVTKLAEVIDVYCMAATAEIDERTQLSDADRVGTLLEVINGKTISTGALLPEGKTDENNTPSGAITLALAMKMREDAGNEYQNLSLSANPEGQPTTFAVKLLATQNTYESDSFDDQYDEDSQWPGLDLPEGGVNESVGVTVENGAVRDEVTVGSGEVSATVPAGVAVTDGTTALTLSVSEKKNSESNVTTGTNEELMALDVHIEGVSADNTTPILVNLGKVLPEGMNLGNVSLYHVENGSTNPMTQVMSLSELDKHNEFYYDPATGYVTVAMATFSEVAVVADTVNAWNGDFDYSWYTNAVAAIAEDETEYIIANADQLAAFGAIVGGMAEGIEQDSFSGKTVKLLADINLGDKDNANESLIFHPIGYYYTDDKNADGTTGDYYSTVYSFEGIFDGNGHTISNFYQNTWEIKGDYDGNYYSDAMGLFGYVVKGTVKNLTVDNFSSDGEFTPTGVIAAYAVNSTFENIAITNCKPRVYNTGNGGIVGIGGNSDDPDTYKLTFTNITIDNSNKITALWGSWDVACGGLVGMFRGAGHVYMTNCHVAAQIDVYNDVCGNYQYYWYRYSGMMVGTNKNMITDKEGYTVPETAKFHAENCTVHFGDWNDYYYCELVANSLASYTHDHQFSRLTQIQNVSEIQDESGNWNKTGNFILMNGKTPTETCYHIMKDANGNLYEHKHDVADATNSEINESVNGETVLKENNQRIYLPFNQLFTGYGWGVKHIPVYNGEDYAFEGITILDREVADSVEKFEKADTAKKSYTTEWTVTIGELFKAAKIEDEELTIKGDKVQVTVSPAGVGSTAGGTYTANTTDWTQGTLTFSGTGAATITITDYYFCKPTTINVTVTEKVAVEKFETKFTGDFLYRVGNQNAVKLDSLFKAKEGATIGTVSVTVEALNGTAASGTYTSNATWTNGTIQFNGTGVVKVTIQDYNFCKPTVLYLEVVDAKNITSAAGSNGTDVVLLQNVTYSDAYLYYKNSTLYGNGFTIDITGADHSDLKDSSDTNSNKSAYCNIWMVDSRFDNVKITGSVYPEVGMTADSDYGNAAIRTEGECYITNSYISNTRVPLRVQGNTTLINTVVDGGRYANIELRSGKLTLDGVTTINTVRKGSDGTTDVIGFGIVIHDEAANASIAIIGDGLKQYNWAGENAHKTILSGDFYLNSAYGLVFNANNSDTIYFDYNDDRYVNTGILCLCADMNKDVVTGLDDRYCQEVSGYDAWVLTYDNSKHAEWFNESIAVKSVDFNPEQGSVIPDYTGNEAQTVEFTKGETYYFDTSVLKAEKFGQILSVSSVVMNDTTYNYGDKIPMTEGGVYEIVYTVVDPYNYSADASSTTTVKHTVSVTVTAIAKDAEILAPKFTFIDQNGNKYESTTVKVGDKTYVMPNVTAADPTTNSMSSINIGSISISGTTVYFPVAKGYTVRSGSNFNRYYPLFNGINITDYTIAGDRTGTTYTTSGNNTSLVGSSGTKFIIPANGGQTNCGDYVKTDGQAGNAAGNSDSGWQGAGYNTSYDGTYLKSGNTNASNGADKNGYERIVWVEYCFNAGNGDVYYYRIGYHCNKESAQGCVTPDTLVTLADGSQKRIDQVTYTDQLLAWDFYQGKYAVVPAAVLINHGEGIYKIITLQFDNGTKVKVVGGHEFFVEELNKWVFIDDTNVSEYIGMNFIRSDGNTMKTITLVDYSVVEDVTTAYSIFTALYYNCFVENVLSLTPSMFGSTNYYVPFEIGDNMKYDTESMQADIEKYGLYTYEDFADHVTYEQFVGFNAPYFKVSVGKGLVTYEQLIESIYSYVNVN